NEKGHFKHFAGATDGATATSVGSGVKMESRSLHFASFATFHGLLPITRLLCVKADRKGSRKPTKDRRLLALSTADEPFEVWLLERQPETMRKGDLDCLVGG